jgi:hypothetical protein
MNDESLFETYHFHDWRPAAGRGESQALFAASKRYDLFFGTSQADAVSK